MNASTPHYDRDAGGTGPAGTDRDWLTLTGLPGRSTLRADGWLCFCVCHALHAPPVPDRFARRAPAQDTAPALPVAPSGR
ncbi:hypothetical protein [Streptomyces sp. NPDC056883]|uniref:hypothetical protein n=1 Tax=Streptomyces sp. NPDC056883 TaxID=3345959 RepID=UPI0036B7AC50